MSMFIDHANCGFFERHIKSDKQLHPVFLRLRLIRERRQLTLEDARRNGQRATQAPQQHLIIKTIRLLRGQWLTERVHGICRSGLRSASSQCACRTCSRFCAAVCSGVCRGEGSVCTIFVMGYTDRSPYLSIRYETSPHHIHGPPTTRLPVATTPTKPARRYNR